MSVGAVLAAVAALGAIATAFYGVFKWTVNTFTKTPEQRKLEIDQAVDAREKKMDIDGRPS